MCHRITNGKNKHIRKQTHNCLSFKVDKETVDIDTGEVRFFFFFSARMKSKNNSEHVDCKLYQCLNSKNLKGEANHASKCRLGVKSYRTCWFVK